MLQWFVSARRAWWWLHAAANDLRFHAELLALRWRNRFSRQSVLGQAPVAVSLTSHGPRVDSVFLTIESIARSTPRPSRFVLWLDDPKRFAELPRSLRRLAARGLEVRLSPGYGPHTKYYPYVEAGALDGLALVTADDDLIYPPGWLAGLASAHRARPFEIHCYRARRMLLDADGLRPYVEWPLCDHGLPDTCNFLTGVSGVIYPTAFLARLRALGPVFTASCPRADDIWLNLVALRMGMPVRQVQARAAGFRALPGSQEQALWPVNMGLGGNDCQLAATYTADDLERLRRAPPARRPPPAATPMPLPHGARRQHGRAA